MTLVGSRYEARHGARRLSVTSRAMEAARGVFPEKEARRSLTRKIGFLIALGGAVVGGGAANANLHLSTEESFAAGYGSGRQTASRWAMEASMYAAKLTRNINAPGEFVMESTQVSVLNGSVVVPERNNNSPAMEIFHPIVLTKGPDIREQLFGVPLVEKGRVEIVVVYFGDRPDIKFNLVNGGPGNDGVCRDASIALGAGGALSLHDSQNRQALPVGASTVAGQQSLIGVNNVSLPVGGLLPAQPAYS